jgi:hypothetical protein
VLHTNALEKPEKPAMSSPSHGGGEWGRGQRSFDGAKEQEREREHDSNPLYGVEDQRSSSHFFEDELQDAGTSSHYPNSASARFEAMTEELSPPVGAHAAADGLHPSQGAPRERRGASVRLHGEGTCSRVSFRAGRARGSCASCTVAAEASRRSVRRH